MMPSGQYTPRPKWSPQTKLTVSLLGVAFGVYLLYQFRAILPPLILAVVLAYAVSPIASFLHLRLRLPHAVAIIFGDIILLALLLGVPALLLPPLATQLSTLNVDLLQLLQSIDRLLQHDFAFGPFSIHLPSLVLQSSGDIETWIQPLVGQTLNLAAEALSSAVWVVFVFVVSFYLVRDGTGLGDWLDEHIPAPYRADYHRLRDGITKIWEAFFRGQITLALVVALIFIITGFIIGLPFALAMGILAGLLEFLPSIGHGIWLMLALPISLLFGSTWIPAPHWVFALIVLSMHLVYQQFDLNYLIPRIIGRSVHLPPLIVIMGIVAGAIAAGVIGIPLAAPTIATLRVLGRYIYAQLFDLDPFPESIAPSLSSPDPQWYRRIRLPFAGSRTFKDHDHAS
ncbi:MAG: AI-2E family transporter [Anaerolineales bacterium]